MNTLTSPTPVFLDSAPPPQPRPAEVILDVQGLQVALPADADRPFAIEHLDVRIEAGQTLCIVGESGSGKSVLATTVMGLLAKGLKATQGHIRLAGETLMDQARLAPESRLRAWRGTRMGMVFQ